MGARVSLEFVVKRQDRLKTPNPSVIRHQYQAMERLSAGFLAVECLAVLLALGWIGFHLYQSNGHVGLWPWMAAVIGSLGVFRWMGYHLFMSKKRLEDIRQDAKFGEHTRDSLMELSQTVFSRLGLPRDAAPVFLIREKDVNAHAVRCELLPGQRLFNGVFLNRSIIHLLNKPELASVIGHELGHVFPYAPILSRCYLIHSLFGGSVSMAVALWLGTPGLTMMATIAILWFIDWMIAIPHAKISRVIEFLCDDFGAKASGLLPALKSELKFGVENETRQRLLLRTLKARTDGNSVNLKELLEAYEQAVPFGKADPETFEKEFRRLTSKSKGNSRGVSMKGFYRFLQGADDSEGEPEESEVELVEKLSLMERLPLVPIERGDYLQDGREWTLQDAEKLIFSIEQHPECVVARLENEVDDRHSTHPAISRRLLYLWRNRDQFPLKLIQSAIKS
jgi:Zn-dependent protease with chaperone function